MSEKNIVLTKQQIVDGETILKVLCLILVMFGLVVLVVEKRARMKKIILSTTGL